MKGAGRIGRPRHRRGADFRLVGKITGLVTAAFSGTKCYAKKSLARARNDSGVCNEERAKLPPAL